MVLVHIGLISVWSHLRVVLFLVVSLFLAVGSHISGQSHFWVAIFFSGLILGYLVISGWSNFWVIIFVDHGGHILGWSYYRWSQFWVVQGGIPLECRLQLVDGVK